MRRKDDAGIRQRQQLRPQRVVEFAAKLVGRPPERRAQIRTAHIADEQRVAGEHRIRFRGAAIQIEDLNRNRFRRVSRRFECLQPDVPELDAIAVGERRERILRLCRGAEVNRGADAIAQLQMSGDEVGVEVRQQHVPDREAVLRCECHVLIDVALRIDHRGSPTGFISDEV
jgi:hypothetical protein